MFIFHTARIALQRGFLQEGGGRHAQALLSAILVTSAADLISPHLIDLNKSFGALWTLVLPLVMLLVWAEGRMVALESGKILTAVAEALHQHNINPAETTDVMVSPSHWPTLMSATCRGRLGHGSIVSSLLRYFADLKLGGISRSGHQLHNYLVYSRVPDRVRDCVWLPRSAARHGRLHRSPQCLSQLACDMGLAHAHFRR